jgi:hypothetical protein
MVGEQGEFRRGRSETLGRVAVVERPEGMRGIVRVDGLWCGGEPACTPETVAKVALTSDFAWKPPLHWEKTYL